jgi:hypothetical protein
LLGIDVVPVPIVNGAATLVWEVTATQPLALESVFFGVFFSSTSPLDMNAPAATVNGSFAATGTPPAAGQVPSGPIPRFVDNSTANNVITVLPCQTTLLFPFVTDQSGFDTGLTISNTTTDPFNTSAQTGTCTLNAYGKNAPPPVTSPSISTATSYTVLASTTFPNFVGYVIAVCNFQYAHGFAFISDVGARNLAAGYLSLILIGRPGQSTLTNSESLAF